ncbi:MAG TPA: hypothetical protein VIH87_04085 [Methylocella sp.]
MPTIFRPDNEPYLGRESLVAFDQLIVACLKANEQIASKTHVADKSRLQLAACQIIPSGISLALSTRELVRQGYLYGALVLGRPLAERAMTILYLHKLPTKLDIWHDGWSYKKRPSLAKMINEIGADKFPGVGGTITDRMNSLTHGDPESAMWNTIKTGDASYSHPVSKILDRPDICDHVCLEAASWLAVLIGMAIAIFPISKES